MAPTMASPTYLQQVWPGSPVDSLAPISSDQLRLCNPEPKSRKRRRAKLRMRSAAAGAGRSLSRPPGGVVMYVGAVKGLPTNI